jgi:hypothetical protein
MFDCSLVCLLLGGEATLFQSFNLAFGETKFQNPALAEGSLSKR